MNIPFGAARAAVFTGALVLSALALAGENSDKPATSRDLEWSEPARDFDWANPTDPRLARARQAIDVEDWTGAVQILVRVVAESPENADAYSYLGLARRKLGDPDQALIYYGQALYLDPNNRGAIKYLGELYLDLNELPKAEQQLERLARVCGADCDAYRDLNEQVRRFKAGLPRG